MPAINNNPENYALFRPDCLSTDSPKPPLRPRNAQAPLVVGTPVLRSLTPAPGPEKDAEELAAEFVDYLAAEMQDFDNRAWPEDEMLQDLEYRAWREDSLLLLNVAGAVLSPLTKDSLLSVKPYVASHHLLSPETLQLPNLISCRSPMLHPSSATRSSRADACHSSFPFWVPRT
ncbi:hypothetical protein CEK25_005973 [Fusarium fujikuroi]|nr:hypothetical protein CEK25_005973 [Fusarium fujikuroi]